jgi:hypothetical protein
MYTEPNASGGVYELHAADDEHPNGRWVSIMWYVCSARIWDFPGDFDVHAVYPYHNCAPDEPTDGCVKWTARTVRDEDGYNGTIEGRGEYVVCLPGNAYACRDPHDYDDQPDGNTSLVYTTGICPSGSVPLPGAGTCNGPFKVGL